MENVLHQKWNDILDHVQDFGISGAAFRTFIKPLSIYKVDGTNLTILIEDEKIGLNKNYYKNYEVALQVSIEDFTGIQYDISFVSLSEVSDNNTETKAIKPANNRRFINGSINRNYTFDTFIVGGNNDFAHAASLKVAEEPGGTNTYNPLFIYGEAGLGKTHLMHAIANYILDHNDDMNVMYVTSERFTNEVIEAIRDGKNEHSTAREDFRKKYRNVDVLLIDDIQFIIGKDATQEEFFHTFNHLSESGKQIVISSDKHPSTMTTLAERLRSRFEMGLTVDIKSPTYETRMAILRKKVMEGNIQIDDSILDYIASNIVSNIRELQGAINKVISFSNLCNKQITMDLAKEALSDLINPNLKRQITVDYIMETVADHYGITVDEITSKKRNSSIVFPRQVCMYLCRKLTDDSLEEIGNKLGNRHHSTILHGIDIITESLDDPDNNRELVNTIDVLCKKISPQ